MEAFFADVITTVHLTIVTFMILGLALVLIGWPLRWQWIRNPWFRISHLAIMGYIAFNAIRGEFCFLTTWEHSLRKEAGQFQGGEDEWSFVGRLLHNILFVEMPQEELNKYYLVFGALVLVSIVCVRPRFRRKRTSAITT